MKRAVLLAIIPVLFFAQANYKIQKDVISSGGTKMTAGNYVLHGTVSQTTIGSVTGGNYKGIIGFWQPFDWVNPRPPYIVRATKSGNNVILTWNKVTLDVNGYPEVIQYYSVYKDTLPNYTPGSGTFVGNSTGPDTTYTDLASLNSIRSFYYLVKAVDYGPNRSFSSNMGFKFNKLYNENASSSDRNWVSLPYRTVYSLVADLTTDLSVAGNPLIKIVNLKNNQLYENWLWDPDFLEWYGDNFAVDSGRAYEMETIRDTTLYLVGWDNPNGYITLNENSPGTDRNWVSVPYNANYSSASAITTDYSPAGNPLIKLTNLRNEQLYENWLWDPDFLEWYGDNFLVERGRGYELETIRDTLWRPARYANNFNEPVLLTSHTRPSIEVMVGHDICPKRSPVWSIPVEQDPLVGINVGDPAIYRPVDKVCIDIMPSEPVDRERSRCSVREFNASHVVLIHLSEPDLEDIIFTAYRLVKPSDALTEQIIGCGVARKKDLSAVWFDAGNFRNTWHAGDQVMILVEGIKDGRGWFGTKCIKLDDSVSLQMVETVPLERIPEIQSGTGLNSVSWDESTNENVIGYSLYYNQDRLNNEIVVGGQYSANKVPVVKPVVKGGYETSYASYVARMKKDLISNITYTFAVGPNPFVKRAEIKYSLARPVDVDIAVFDLSGRKVKTLINGHQKAGYYQVKWQGEDNAGREIATGIYFVRMTTEDYQMQEKLVYVR